VLIGLWCQYRITQTSEEGWRGGRTLYHNAIGIGMLHREHRGDRYADRAAINMVAVSAKLSTEHVHGRKNGRGSIIQC